MAEATHHGFTPERVAWMDRRFGAGQPAAHRSFDRPTIMWMVGGLTALGVAVSGVLYSEIGSVRDEVGSRQDQITHTEAILDERPPRGE